MRTSRPVAEKLGAIRQDPDLDGLLFGLISRATGGCHEHAARLDHIHVVGAGRGLTKLNFNKNTLFFQYETRPEARGRRVDQNSHVKDSGGHLRL